MQVFNELVRDKISEIIAQNGDHCETEIMSDDAYLAALNQKLQEGLNEYLASGDIEELADLAEVMRAILDFKFVKIEDFEALREVKVEKRGAFKKRRFC